MPAWINAVDVPSRLDPDDQAPELVRHNWGWCQRPPRDAGVWCSTARAGARSPVQASGPARQSPASSKNFKGGASTSAEDAAGTRPPLPRRAADSCATGSGARTVDAHPPGCPWPAPCSRSHFSICLNLDSLPTHDLEPLDPDAQVVNPVRRALEKTIRRVRSRLATSRNRLAEALQEHHRDTATRLEADANALAAELDQLKQQRDSPMSAPATCRSRTWTPCRLAGACSWTWCGRLSRGDPHDGAGHHHPGNARRLLRALLTSDANIIPQPAKGIASSFSASATPATACSLPWSRNSTQPAWQDARVGR